MKALIATAMLMLSGAAQASTVCTISAQSPNTDLVFGEVLFTSEVTSPKYIIVDSVAKNAHEVEFSKLDTVAKWKDIDGKLMVTLSQQEKQFAITASKVDWKNEKNALPLLAMATGGVEGDQYLNLILAPKKFFDAPVTIRRADVKPTFLEELYTGLDPIAVCSDSNVSK